MTLKRITYLVHDEVPGIDLPELYWDDITGEFFFGSIASPKDVTITGNLTLSGSFSRSRAQMESCGSQNLKDVTEASPLVMPFAYAYLCDSAVFTFHAPGVIELLTDGYYLLSYNLPFEADPGIILQGASVGACWQWSADSGVNWNDLIPTKSFDTVHGQNDDHGAITLPPVEQALPTGMWLRVVAFSRGTSTPVYVNSNDIPGGYDWAWARIEAFKLATLPH